MGCGIGGIIKAGTFTYEDALAAYSMLFSLTRRGIDAWGYFDGVEVYKEPGNFVTSPNRERVLSTAGRTSFFLCHTRFATTGDPSNNNNNHPLVLYPFVMAHNGEIFISDYYVPPPNVEVDSYDLLYWISYEYAMCKNVVEAIQRGVMHVVGLYAVWLYNFDDGYVYLFRNYNPLLITSALIGDGIVMFASDKRAIRDALSAYSYDSMIAHKLHRRPTLIERNKIYRLSARGIEEVGEFTSNPVPFNLSIGYVSKRYQLLKFHLEDLGWED